MRDSTAHAMEDALKEDPSEEKDAEDTAEE